jgi:tyrosinase-like protein
MFIPFKYILFFRQANQRFLPWHRVYLIKFEEMLNDVMKKEEPGRDYNIAFSYWDWEHDRAIPELFKDLKPSMDVEVYFYDKSEYIVWFS